MLFKITNISRSSVLADSAEIAQTIFSRIKGLLGRSSLKEGQALIIKSCDSIHTFFMKFPIDVVFVNKNNRVIRILENFKPFRLSPIVWTARYVVELPVGAIKSTLTQIGDQLQVKPV